VVAGAALFTTEASAQTNPVTATGKGVTGGALLGAELGMMPQAIAGVDKWWTYAIGGGVGAVAGGVGGYFLETEVTSAQPSLFLLAGGMALVIPTVVLTLNATSYKLEVEEGEIVSEDSATDVSEPTVDAPTDAGPGDGPAPIAPPTGGPADPGAAPAGPAPAGPAPQSRVKRMRAPGRAPITPALLSLDLGRRGLSLRPGVPAVDVRPLYSPVEVAQFGVTPGTQVLIPAVAGRF